MAGDCFARRAGRRRNGFLEPWPLKIVFDQNIAYGKPEASRVEIIRAAKLANAHDFIEQMPQGYDTVIGERGETLSGGQGIAIARANIRDTAVLFLNEPSTGLEAAFRRTRIRSFGLFNEEQDLDGVCSSPGDRQVR